MYCRKCGNQINNGDNKCSVCGELVLVNTNPQDTSSQRYKLTISRVKSFVGCLMTFKIYVDGVLVAKLKNGESTILEITGGKHVLSVDNKNAVDVNIAGDTVAEVAVLSAGYFGFTKISGPGISEAVSNMNVASKKDNTNTTLIASIILPIVSVVLMYTLNFYIQFWVYGLLIGYAIININSLKDKKGTSEYTSSLIKNIIAIIISSLAIILTGFLIF